MRILVIEDDPNLNSTLCFCLKQAGYEADGIMDGEDGLYFALHSSYDLLILDRRLPVLDGLTILKALRQRQIFVPVILLTALNSLQDRIDGLDSGADDYIAKPFEIDELFARIRALLRRPAALSASDRLTFGNSVLDTGRSELKNESLKLSCSLTPKENELLGYFIKNCEQTLARERILNYIWGIDADVESGNLDNYIYFLRKRLRFVKSDYKIRTLKGTGFILEKHDDSENT